MISITNATEFVRSRQIKNLLPRLGPCISIYLPLGFEGAPYKALTVRLRGALGQAEAMLSQAGNNANPALPSPDLWQYTKDPRMVNFQGSIAIFDTPGYTAIVRIAADVAESVHCNEDFYILPLLAYVQRDRLFHLLALSEKQVRLLRCSLHSVEEVPLAETLPHSLLEAGQFSAPDHTLENRSSAGQNSGAGRRIRFSTSAEEGRRDARFRSFLTTVDQAIQPMLRKSADPLMLAGVRRLTAVYKEVSTYAPLLKESVDGSPETLSVHDLHQRALKTWDQHLDSQQRIALQEIQAEKQARRTVKDPLQLLHDAEHGRIQKLLLSTPGGDDASNNLLNHLALETMRHGGKVLVMTNPEFPTGTAIGITRYESSAQSETPAAD